MFGQGHMNYDAHWIISSEVIYHPPRNERNARPGNMIQMTIWATPGRPNGIWCATARIWKMLARCSFLLVWQLAVWSAAIYPINLVDELCSLYRPFCKRFSVSSIRWICFHVGRHSNWLANKESSECIQDNKKWLKCLDVDVGESKFIWNFKAKP